MLIAQTYEFHYCWYRVNEDLNLQLNTVIHNLTFVCCLQQEFDERELRREIGIVIKNIHGIR